MRENEAGYSLAPPIGIATVLPPVERFSVDNVSPTYRGVVQTDDGPVVAIIKDVPAKELANELLAASIAVAAGLPVPTPLLALAAPDTGIGTGCPMGDGSGGLVFASTNVGGASVRQIYLQSPTGVTEALIAERLGAWPDGGRLYGFDTWIANTDRNPGNLLFGGAGGIWLIDHAYGFTGPAWDAEALDPTGEYANKLAEWLTPCLGNDQRTEMAKTVGHASDPLDRAALDRLADTSHIAMLLTAGDREAVLAFLAERSAHVPRLATGALGFLA